MIKIPRSKMRLGQIVLTLLICIIFAAPAVRAQSAEKPLSSEEKTEVFEKVWKIVNEEYYDPKLNGIDWAGVRTKFRPQLESVQTDAEFYSLLKRMVGAMQDSHTRFLTPREALERKQKQAITLGVTLAEVEGKIVIARVAPETEAMRAGIAAGMIVRQIDGQNIVEKIAAVQKEIVNSSSERATKLLVHRRSLSGEPETQVRLNLIRADGSEFETTLTRKVVPQISKATAKKLVSGIGYISLNSFMSPAAETFKTELEKIKDAPALVVDLRYNGGGNIIEVMKIAGLFVNEKTSLGRMMFRSGKTGNKAENFSVGKKGKQVYAAPLVVLVNEASASGSELFSSSLQEAGRAQIVGAQSCGCLLGISERHRFKGGGALEISDIGFLSSKGNIVEKIGVTPDKTVALTIADLQNNFDNGLAAAEQMLLEKLKK